MEQVVFDINHLQPPQAHLDLTGTQSPFVVASGLHSSVGLESNSSLSKSPIHCIFSSLCHDPLGWGPVDKNFVFTPCFINGAIANIPNLIALVFGSYQLYSLSKKKAHSIPIDWHLFVKLVCCCFPFFIFLSDFPTNLEYHYRLWSWFKLFSILFFLRSSLLPTQNFFPTLCFGLQ